MINKQKSTFSIIAITAIVIAVAAFIMLYIERREKYYDKMLSERKRYCEEVILPLLEEHYKIYGSYPTIDVITHYPRPITKLDVYLEGKIKLPDWWERNMTLITGANYVIFSLYYDKTTTDYCKDKKWLYFHVHLDYKGKKDNSGSWERPFDTWIEEKRGSF